MQVEDSTADADATCRRVAEYLLADGASPDEFLAAASSAASAHARSAGPLTDFHVTAMNLSDQWDESTPEERQRLRPTVQDLARRAVAELPER